MHRPTLVGIWQGLWLRTYTKQRRHMLHNSGLHDQNIDTILGLVGNRIGKACFCDHFIMKAKTIQFDL